jgi:hypothetical protein
MASWAEDLVYGAITNGVNHPTFAALNVVLLLAVLSLAFLLFTSIQTNPALVPHAAFLLFLAIGLWAAIIWFISNIGLTDSEQQRKQLFGEEKVQDGAQVQASSSTAAASKAANKEE